MQLSRALAVKRLTLLLCSLLAALPLAAASYDPLAIAPQFEATSIELEVRDAAHERDIPLRVYLPASMQLAPVVLFSHGLGGSRAGSAFLGRHWAARGYIAVFLQHPGSDESVWRNVLPARRMAALREAANLANFRARVQDVPAVLDALTRWQSTPAHVLAGRLDLAHIGMSGHSFGAVTTQAVSGQHYPLLGARFTDPRIRAATIMSPNAPPTGPAARAFASVALPWLLMTGTHDLAAVGGADMTSRLAVFPALPNGDKYELVLAGAEHSAFTERALPGDAQPRNPNHHRAILAISTAFWDAYLRGDVDAHAWLAGVDARNVLQAGDRWQRK